MAKSAILAAGVAGVIAASLIVPTTASAATKTKLVIAATTATKTYGGPEPTLGYTVYGLAKGDKLTRKPTCKVPAHRNVGQYTITCSGAAANTTKYTITYRPGALYVGKARLYVGPAYAQKTYGEVEPAFTYVTYGLVDGDKLVTTPTCSVAGAHTDAGRYALTCTGADAGANYDLRTVDGYYDVLKRSLYVAPNKQAIYYGSPEPAFTFTTVNLAPGEKLVKDPTCGVAGEHSHVGTYAIRCTGAQASSNYALTVYDGQYQVGQNATVVAAEQASISKNLLGQTTGATIRAQLYLVHPYARVFTDQTLTFTAADTTLCTAVTDKDGIGTCKLDAKGAAAVVANDGYTVTYAGQGTDIAGSTATKSNS